MRIKRVIFLLSLSLILVSPAVAQDGIMGSAETINEGNFKLMVNPIFIFGPGSAEELGIGLQGGYGLSQNMDVEARLVFYDFVTFVGADVEFWLVKDSPLDVSVGVGGHFADFDGFKVKGLDARLLASAEIAEKLELYGGLDVAFEFPDEPLDSFQRVNLVPGLEYRVSQDIDFMLEVGLGLNDDSFDYISAGIAYYLR